ncbi:MAG: carboxypeptidase regulatory-like domain-containing protein [Deltaproteobacteria bacterium]|nr:carboxypeptidase regulatory-like domain-containing protein [Deltaproteobacteria bacterium]
MFFSRHGKGVFICSTAACAAILLVLMLRPCLAELQPSFITGTIYNAATGAPLRTATIKTTTGLSFSVPNGFFFLSVPPNVYDFIVSAPGFRSNMSTGIFSGPGQTTTVNIWLASASTSTGRLQGRVAEAGANSGGIAGALVFSDLGAIAVTDADGYFTAAGPSGSAIVTVAAHGYSSKIIKNVQIQPSGIRSLPVRLNKSMKSTTGSVSGIVRDACSKSPLAGVNITSSNGVFVQTSDGSFKISVPPGRTSLLASAEGYQCAWQTSALALFPVGSFANFSLAPLDRGMGTVEGFITNAANGEPLPGARIATDLQDIGFSEKADGSYTLKANSCASTITVTRKGFQPYTTTVTIGKGTTTDLNIALQPLTDCIATGTIQNLLTGEPVAQAQVSADNGSSAVSDDTGAFSLTIPSCTATITVCANGFFKSWRRVSTAGDMEIITLTINLIPCPLCSCSAPATALLYDAR